MNVKKIVEDIYDYESSLYDKGRYANPGGRYINEIELRLAYKFLKPGMVLELATGTGRFITPLSKLGFDCVGIDISLKMLKMAANKASKLKVETHLLKMDAENLGFRDECFDNVLIAHAFKFMDPSKVLQESLRVLRKKGRIILICEAKDHPLRRLFLIIKDHSIFCKLLKYAKIGLPNLIEHFYSLYELCNILENTGFKVTYFKRIFNFPFKFYRSINNEYIIKVLSMFDNKLPFGWINIVVGEKNEKRPYTD